MSFTLRMWTCIGIFVLLLPTASSQTNNAVPTTGFRLQYANSKSLGAGLLATGVTQISWSLQYTDFSCTSSRSFLYSYYDVQCQQRCASDAKCAAYAIWPQTGWCQTYEDCTGPAADPGKKINAYLKNSSATVSTPDECAALCLDAFWVNPSGSAFKCYCTTSGAGTSSLTGANVYQNLLTNYQPSCILEVFAEDKWAGTRVVYFEGWYTSKEVSPLKVASMRLSGPCAVQTWWTEWTSSPKGTYLSGSYTAADLLIGSYPLTELTAFEVFPLWSQSGSDNSRCVPTASISYVTNAAVCQKTAKSLSAPYFDFDASSGACSTSSTCTLSSPGAFPGYRTYYMGTYDGTQPVQIRLKYYPTLCIEAGTTSVVLATCNSSRLAQQFYMPLLGKVNDARLRASPSKCLVFDQYNGGGNTLLVTMDCRGNQDTNIQWKFNVLYPKSSTCWAVKAGSSVPAAGMSIWAAGCSEDNQNMLWSVQQLSSVDPAALITTTSTTSTRTTTTPATPKSPAYRLASASAYYTAFGYLASGALQAAVATVFTKEECANLCLDSFSFNPSALQCKCGTFGAATTGLAGWHSYQVLQTSNSQNACLLETFTGDNQTGTKLVYYEGTYGNWAIVGYAVASMRVTGYCYVTTYTTDIATGTPSLKKVVVSGSYSSADLGVSTTSNDIKSFMVRPLWFQYGADDWRCGPTAAPSTKSNQGYCQKLAVDNAGNGVYWYDYNASSGACALAVKCNYKGGFPGYRAYAAGTIGNVNIMQQVVQIKSWFDQTLCVQAGNTGAMATMQKCNPNLDTQQFYVPFFGEKGDIKVKSTPSGSSDLCLVFSGTYLLTGACSNTATTNMQWGANTLRQISYPQVPNAAWAVNTDWGALPKAGNSLSYQTNAYLYGYTQMTSFSIELLAPLVSTSTTTIMSGTSFTISSTTTSAVTTTTVASTTSSTTTIVLTTTTTAATTLVPTTAPATSTTTSASTTTTTVATTTTSSTTTTMAATLTTPPAPAPPTPETTTSSTLTPTSTVTTTTITTSLTPPTSTFSTSSSATSTSTSMSSTAITLTTSSTSSTGTTTTPSTANSTTMPTTTSTSTSSSTSTTSTTLAIDTSTSTRTSTSTAPSTTVTSPPITGTMSATNTSTGTTTTGSSTSTVTSTSTTGTSSSTSTSQSTTTTSSDTTTTFTTTQTPPPAVVIAPAPPPCEDKDAFRDVKGLGCEDWYGQNCSVPPQGYNSTDLKSVQDNCPVSCGFCPGTPKPKLVIQQAKQVNFGMQIQVDLSSLSREVQYAAVKASFAAALGVSLDAISSVTIEEVPGRRLQGSSPKYNVRCEVVVPPSTQVRTVLLQATSLSTPSTTSFDAFQAGLAAAGVDTSSMAVAVTAKPSTTTVSVAVHSDGSISALRDASSSATSGNTTDGSGGASGTTGSSSAVTAVIAVGCEDNQDFVDEQGEGCSGWVGYACDSVLWLRTEKPYTAKGLSDVQAQCPLSCGQCSPPSRLTPAALKAACADDAYIGGFCLRWRGVNCSDATSLGYSAGYQQLLLSRCPLSCGLCGNVTPPLFDTPGFQDELGNNCSTWAGSDCTKMYAGYTRKGMLNLQAACQESCFGRQRLLAGAPTCEDDSTFSYLQQYKCQDFVGRICTYATLYLNARWLLGPRGALAWHENIWGHCPVACGLCDPQDRPAVSDLLIECQDDPYIDTWCAYKWKGQDCHKWDAIVNLVVPHEPARFNATVFGRCASACGLCKHPVCQAGTFRDTRRHVCTECPVGTYMPTATSGPDALSCLVAQRGFSVARAGAIAQEPCQLGDYSSAAGQPACDACEPGRFAGSRGAEECTQCEAGRFQTMAGMSACERCPRGTFMSTRGATACTACPGNFTTLLEASTSNVSCGCAPGQWRPPNRSACEDCPVGISCPGGHGYLDDGPDLTAVLLPGMMSLPEDVGSVYTCAALEETCPGYRPLPYTPELFAETCPGNRRGPRCAKCPKGWYFADDGSCADCGAPKGPWGLGLNILAAWLVGIYATERCYRSCEMFRSEGQFTFWALVNFAQGMVPAIKLPLAWPAIFMFPIQFFITFSIPGFWDLWSFNFQLRCLLGESFVWETIKNVCIPLFSFVNVGMLYIVFPLTCRRVSRPMALCCLACIWDGYWIALCIMAVMLFPTDIMPNGKEFLRYNPGVELGTQDWKAALPLGLSALLIYVCGYLTYTIFGVLGAPRLAAEKPSFWDQFGYIVYMYTPEAYWWGLVIYVVNFSCAMIQAFGSVYWQIYATLFVLIAAISFELWVYPSVFLQLNRINISMKAANAFFLILSVCFVDTQDPEVRVYISSIPQILMWVGIGVSAVLLVTLGRSICVGEGQRGWRAVHNQRMARKARAVMTLITAMPEHKFIPALKNFFDSDIDKMKQYNMMLTAAFLHMQSGKHWWQSRIIPNAQPGVYDRRRVSIQAHELVCRGVVRRSMERNVMLHKLLDRLQVLILEMARENLDPFMHPISTAVAASFETLRSHLKYAPDVQESEMPVSPSRGERLSVVLRIFGADDVEKERRKKAHSLRLMEEVPIQWPRFLAEFSGRHGFSEKELLQLYKALDHDRTGAVPLARIVAIVLSHSCVFAGEEEPEGKQSLQLAGLEWCLEDERTISGGTDEHRDELSDPTLDSAVSSRQLVPRMMSRDVDEHRQRPEPAATEGAVRLL